MQVSEIGWLLAASDLTPFIKIVVMFVLQQSPGCLSLCSDMSNITLVMEASSTRSFSRIGRMLSAPAALPGLRLSGLEVIWG